MRGLRSRKWRAVILTWTIVFVFGAGLLYHNGQGVYRVVTEEYWRSTFASTDGDVRGDLASGRFGPGTAVDDLIAAHPPGFIHRNGTFTLLRYGFLRLAPGQHELPGSPSATTHALGESTWVWAKDGKIIAAFTKWQLGEGGGVRLFGEVTDADSKLFQALNHAGYVGKYHASMALASCAGACHFELPAVALRPE